MRGSAPVDIIGRACRLPGARDCAALWRVLAEGRCTVSEIGEDRWAKARFYNPRIGERGKSYTFAAGVLDDIWGFDPGVFGLSPREAEQMDPQQRVLLQVVWEALEDAGVPPSTLAGQAVGVYVGVSSPDTATRRAHDVGTSDAFTMTGSTLSLVANRISHVFDWRGPSFIVDTACSSSLVALSQALDALQAGRIDTAVVGGVNLLLSPFPFLGFSAARMLSPEGRCRPFDANGQGYVRAEGAVALVLRRRDAGPIGAGRAYAEVVAAGVNSDGRTSGISLPSADSQAALLTAVYDAAGVSPGDLAFIEAHGTGTRVGDPAEAEAIGRVLGRRRRAALPIGSIKSNIGHLEPAAGLAGMLKAMLAFEHDLLPASLFFEWPNPAIPFADLNLTVAGTALPLARSERPRLAGISSFGFGGTNAHVILREKVSDILSDTGPQPRSIGETASDKTSDACTGAGVLMLSAHCRDGLAALAREIREMQDSHQFRWPTEKDGAERTEIGGCPAFRALAATIAHTRERLPERLVVTSKAALDAFLVGTPSPAVLAARAVAQSADVAFVYAGNGSQWAGMGRLAYAQNTAFRDRFDALSRHFADLAGWSLTETLLLDDLADQIASASIAQPLIFAIQAALTDALAGMGLTPSVVAGHSVGEVAAAYAAGVLDEGQALRVIHARSSSQEAARGLGGMAAVALPTAAAQRLLDDCDAADVEIGAVNSPSSVTLSGPHAEIARVARIAEANGHRVKVLDLDYPFHSELMAAARAPLLDALDGLAPSAGRVQMVSTVTGDLIAGETLDAAYWWRNVRAPVRFAAAIDMVVACGARVLLEIAPKSILQGYLGECLAGRGRSTAVLASLGARDPDDHDPVRSTFARALAYGARVDLDRAFGPPDPSVRLPHYPWRNRHTDVPATLESTSMMQTGAVEHPLLGWRERAGLPEWFVHLDTDVFPALADHCIGGEVYVPGAVLAEMALAAACRFLDAPRAEIADLDILAPLVLARDHMREVRTQIDAGSRALTIASRRRLSDEPWQVHVEARYAGATEMRDAEAAHGVDALPVEGFDAADFYAAARQLGLDYGPRFRRLAGLAIAANGTIVVDIAGDETTSDERLLIDPNALDVAFHGLLHRLLIGPDQRSEGYVPIRIGRVRVLQPGAPVRHARLTHVRRGPTTARCDVLLLDAASRPVAELRDVRFRAATLTRTRPLPELAYSVAAEMRPLPGFTPSTIAATADVPSRAVATTDPAHEDARLLLEAAARRVALDSVAPFARDGRIAPSELVAEGRLSPAMRAPLEGLLSALERAGLATRDAAAWGIAASELPPLDAIVQTVIGEHPAWWPDCALLAEAAARWPQRLSDPAASLPQEPPYRRALLEAFAVASPRAALATERLLAGVEAAQSVAGRPLRVLEIGCGHGALTRPLARHLVRTGGRLLALDNDARAVAQLGADLAGTRGAHVAATGRLAELAETHGPFDLVVSADLARLGEPAAVLNRIAPHVMEGAMLLGACPLPDTVDAVVMGLHAGGASAPTSWRRLPATAALAEVAMSEDMGSALLTGRLLSKAQLQIAPRARDVNLSVIGLLETPDHLAEALRAHLTGAATSDLPGNVVCVSPLPEIGAASDGALTQRLSALTDLLDALETGTGRLWLVAPGALRAALGRDRGSPVQAAVAAFARTAANERAHLDIRVVDIAPGLDHAAAAERLARLLADPGRDSELLIDADTMAVPRFVRGLPIPPPAPTPSDDGAAARLALSRGPGRDRLTWMRTDRRAPAAGEVEIAIAAAGLNFRDVMWAMGLLPEEALEDGFAGPTLGFECAGRIVRVGAGVTRLAPGQPVIAFAPAAFASHVTVADTVVAPVPAGMTLAAAATVPVAFITAWYALDHLARLAEGETVLIHGGAGGVGLAALQIARHRGARVVATAGSPEKRHLLTLLGADHVLDSRSLAFANDVMALTDGAGVDVVLNSLAGEAMERSLELVRPFGRFLELGKRDFYGAAKIGLRPFRRNVSYFGIDADQLLAQRPDLARRLFAELAGHLENGTFAPLPYRVFPAAEAADAFRLMQQSGHIGKIVVTPPAPADVAKPRATAPFKADPAGTHLVVGGLGGFGLATARWLAACGARRIVLASRSGQPDAAGTEAVAALCAKGIEVEAAAVDVTDSAALAGLLDRIRARGRLAGVVHAAMVLDDHLIARLTSERIARVLAPKVAGADHLDRLTRADALDYFVLYSSVTVMIGNPGQSAYVAANAYLDGLARQRRAAGLPALAVGWGGITDTGYLARNADVGRAIARRTGTATFTAADALDALGQLLAMGADAPAAVTVAPMAWDGVRGQLPLLDRPMFADLLGGDVSGSAARAEPVDLATEIGALDDVQARQRVLGHLAHEVARIFRMPIADVGAQRTLAELGMDSLMGLELRIAVQQRLRSDIPITALAGNQTLAEIAAGIVAALRAGSRAQGRGLEVDLAHQHVGAGVDADRLAPLMREIDRREADAGANP